IGAPLNIWNDHSDAMSMRDAGWIQLFAENNQEAVDLHIQAFRIAEASGCPVMVCVDGFILTHAVEQVDLPTAQEVDAFVPAFVPAQELDPDHPCSIGVLVGPDAFTEVKYLAHKKMLRAADIVLETAAAFEKAFGREAGGFVRSYCTEDAETVIVAMGSVVGTLKDMIDEKRAAGEKIGLVSIGMYRPFPTEAVRKALAHARHVMVVEKAINLGQGGVLAADIRLAGLPDGAHLTTVIAGLGGRPIFKKSISDLVEKIGFPSTDELYFLDLRQKVVDEEEKKIETAGKTASKKHLAA
ncbi:MAG: pyruvate ferredoxin oxidoreductase, partial [Alphaproteobacteria bacterium]|nr:pyruvate ferredoxin oxidoreductase [Alphaproteobacteria bacterium]